MSASVPLLAASNIAWPAAQDDAAAKVLGELGCSGIEVAPGRWWQRPLEASEREIESYRARWEGRGLPIIAMQALLYGRPDLKLFESADSRRAMLSYLEGMARLGGKLGAKALVVGSPVNRRRNSLPLAEALDVAAAFFRRLAETAARHGVTFCVEPNPTEYGCDFINTLAEAVELCERVNHPGFRVQGDAGGLVLAEEQIESALGAAGRVMRHFHISEPHLAEIGTTGVDHGRVARSLLSSGYCGWLSIEMRPAHTDPVDALVRAIHVAQRCYSGVDSPLRMETEG